MYFFIWDQVMRIIYVIILILFAHHFGLYGQIKPSWMWDMHLDNTFVNDATYKAKNSYRYIPVVKDSIFPKEYVTIYYDTVLTKKKQFLRKNHKHHKTLGSLLVGVDGFLRSMGSGKSIHNEFYEYALYSSDPIYGRFGYIRDGYKSMTRKKGYVYSVTYECYLNQRTWLFKPIYSLELQIQHYKKKRERFVELLNYKSRY